MVFAKTSKAAGRLSKQIQEKEFKKEYLAVVDGKFENQNGTLENYLLKNEKKNMSKVVDKNVKNSKYSKLDYEVLYYNQEINMSVIKIVLHTGRHHQIRVQLANINHSISGDQKYGTRGRGKQIALWAYRLLIKNPITGEKMEFTDFPEKIGSWAILSNFM